MQDIQVQPGHIQEGQKERRVALVCLDELLLVECCVGQRQPARRAPLKCLRPVQEDAMCPEKIGHLDSLEQRKRRRVVPDKPIEVPIDEKRRPGLGGGAVSGVGEITGFEPASRRLACMLDATLEGPAPEVDVSLKLLVDFRPTLEVVEAPVDLQGQRAPFVGGSVVSSDRSDHDGMGNVTVGTVFGVAVHDRQADHRGGNQAGEHLVAGNIRWRPQNRENSHDHPHVGIGHFREVDQRGDAARTDECLHHVDLAVERCELVLGSFRKRNVKQGKTVASR